MVPALDCIQLIRILPLALQYVSSIIDSGLKTKDDRNFMGPTGPGLSCESLVLQDVQVCC